MKLLRYGPKGQEKPGLLDNDGKIRDLSGVIADVTGEALSDESMGRLRAVDPAGLQEVPGEPRIGPCVGSVGKFIGIGLNYADHAAETGAAIPKEPVVFNKWVTCISGCNDEIQIPPGSTKTDWEVELGVVIGRRSRYVDRRAALEHVAGFVLHNDYSERAFQIERGGQWVKGKSADGFAPLGPYLVTPDEFRGHGAVRLWLKVNGVMEQDGNTSNLIFDVPTLVAYVSRFMTLLPGDVISTGTPAGVGMGKKPPRYLRVGDVVEYGIDGLGEGRQRIVAPEGPALDAATLEARWRS